MMLVTLIGGVVDVKVMTTKGEREYIEIMLVAQGYDDRKVYWKCRDFYPQHKKLITHLWTGRQVLIQGQVTNNETYMTKHGKPSSTLAMRVGEIIFLPSEENPDHIPIPDKYNVLGSRDQKSSHEDVDADSEQVEL